MELDQSGNFGALYLYNLTRTVVILPPINNGSVMIQGCTRCTFILGAHQVRFSQLSIVVRLTLTEVARCQFRMHDSSNCIIRLATASSPIIERCSLLTFTNYPPQLLTTRHGSVRDMCLELLQLITDTFY